MGASLDDMTSLVLFARVVEARSFTEAARRLSLSKSAVSAQVTRLEARLGVRLLNRTTRSLSLTDAGVRLYEPALRIIAAADEAAQSAAGASGEPRGLLRVNGPIGFSQVHLAAAVADFLRAHPAVTVNLVADDHLVNLVEKGFDLAIRIHIFRPVDSSLVARKLASDQLVICAAPSYLARAGTPRVPLDLVRHDCLRYSSLASGGEWRFQGPDGPFSVPVRGTLTSSDGGVLREAAIAGLGLTVLPRFMVQADLEADRLRKVLSGVKSRGIGIFAVYPHRQTPAHARAFVAFLAERLPKVLAPRGGE